MILNFIILEKNRNILGWFYGEQNTIIFFFKSTFGFYLLLSSFLFTAKVTKLKEKSEE